MDNTKEFDLSTRTGLMAYMRTLPKEMIFEVVAQTTRDLHAREHDEAKIRNEEDASRADETPGPLGAEANKKTPNPSKKSRPVNGFMAFRTHYSSILPHTQQKEISGFITQLWEKDLRRNDWCLLAKTFSTIRDIVGKGNVTLKDFLSYACPIMKIVVPGQYLQTYQWSIQANEDGIHHLHHDASALVPALRNMQFERPTTELELLEAIVSAGFMPIHAQALIDEMGGSANGMMTTGGGNKIEEFMQTLLTDAPATAAQIIGYGENHLFPVNLGEVEDFSQIDEASIRNEGNLTSYPLGWDRPGVAEEEETSVDNSIENDQDLPADQLGNLSSINQGTHFGHVTNDGPTGYGASIYQPTHTVISAEDGFLSLYNAGAMSDEAAAEYLLYGISPITGQPDQQNKAYDEASLFPQVY